MPIANQRGIGAHGFHKQTGGEEVAADVADVAAAGFADEGADGVVARGRLQLVVPQHLEVDKAIAERAEREQHHCGKKDKPAPCGFAILFGAFFLHAHSSAVGRA